MRQSRRVAGAASHRHRQRQRGDDLFGEDVASPEVAQGDSVAMVGIGGYCQSVWTDHCGRPRAGALLFEERA